MVTIPRRIPPSTIILVTRSHTAEGLGAGRRLNPRHLHLFSRISSYLFFFQVTNMDSSESRLVLRFIQGSRVPRSQAKEILRSEGLRLEDAGVIRFDEMMLRILDELRPERAGRRGPDTRAK